MKAQCFASIGASVAVVISSLAGCHIHGDMFKAKFSRSEELTAPVAGITKLDVETNVGKIRLQAAEGTEARVAAEITVKAPSEEEAAALAEGVRIVVEPSGETLVVKAVKPPDFGRNQLVVDFTISAPAALAVDCKTNVGDISVQGFTGRVEAQADVGAIRCEGLRGPVKLHANVGDLRAEYASDAAAAVDVDMSSNVGAIEFAGPQEMSARLTAAANVGSINTERALTVKGSMKQSISATLGDAEGRVNLRTNVGSIRIR